MMFFALGLLWNVSFLDIHRALAADTQAAARSLQQKDFQKVIQLLSPEVEKLDREGLLLLAKAYSGSKNPTSAIKTATAVLAKNSKDVEAKTLIGGEQFTLGQTADAIATLKEAIDINPKFLPAYRQMIRIYDARKNLYELRLIYQDLIDKLGERAEFVTRLCEISTLDRLYDLASKYCQIGIKKLPNEPSNYVYLGIANKETGKADRAEIALKKAADTFEKSEFAQLTYAQHLDEKKNFIGSYSYYRRGVLANSKSIKANLGLALSAFEIQKYQEALSAFEKSCSLDRGTLPDFRRATNTLRTMKNSEWLAKFEKSSEKCGPSYR